ncbi:MAG TPA: chromate transporter [Candidatus Limnocylindria bacterium]|nr:chromate transporter [Candidatus Limnocylindria bacterium]
MTDLAELFILVLKATALGFGGLGSLPILRQDVIATGIASDEQLVQALAIGRLGSGPNALYLVSFGYLVMGIAGAAVALVASCIPPLVMVPAVAAMRRRVLSTWVAGLARGATLAASGLLLAIGVQILGADPAAVLRLPPWQIALAALGVVLTYDGRLHPAVLIAGGAAAGVALGG